MKMELKLSVIYFTIAVVQFVDALNTLDATNTKVLDSYLAKHLQQLTIKKINDSSIDRIHIQQQEEQCLRLINHTIDICVTCMNNCGAQVHVPPPQVQSLQGYDTSLKNILTGIITNPIGTSIDLVLGLGVEHLAHEIGHGIDHISHEVGHGVEHLAHEIDHGVEHLAHELSHGAEHVAHEIGHGVEHLGHELGHLGHGAESVVHDIGHGIEHVGHEVEHGVHHLGHEISHILGKRDTDCNLECPACRDVQNPDTNAVEITVCGVGYRKQMTALQALLPKFREISTALTSGRLIQKVEYDQTSISVDSTGSVQFGVVYVTANVNGTPRRFRTKTPYQMMNQEKSAQQWAIDVFNMFLS